MYSQCDIVIITYYTNYLNSKQFNSTYSISSLKLRIIKIFCFFSKYIDISDKKKKK